MSYQVIARKWRPQIFEEVIGQESVTRTLRNAIEYDRLHHAYIFSGARGVGKTTTARLLAKALNCHKTEKANPETCKTNADDACSSCVEVSESRSLDVLEFDAASNTGVDQIRDLIIENIQISAARDRYKVFIIDEVHMLSRSSFNALLKTLEEPPENVVFVMATTELHKVPDTILSRVQEFEFRTIPLQKILKRLKVIATAEKIDISDAGLKEIARSGEGSMRDAQSNFDQIISFSGEKIGVEDVAAALGIASAENLTKTIESIANKDSKQILEIVDDLISRGYDLRHFCKDLLSFLRDLLVFKMAGEADNLLDTAILGFEDLKKQSEPFTEADLIRFFNSLAETETKLRDANEPRYMLEIGLIKLIEMGRVQPIESILERIVNLETTLSNNSLTIDSTKETEESFASVEKKNLDIENPPSNTPFPTKPNLEPEESNSSETNQTDSSREEIPNRKKLSKFVNKSNTEAEVPSSNHEPTQLIDIDSMPVRLEPIDSEDLEHIEDKWLDAVYEYKLRHEGDNLKAIPNASKIISTLLNIKEPLEAEVSATKLSHSNGSGTATAPAVSNRALDIVSEMTAFEEIDETIPELPETPSQEDLENYARSHPSVKKVLRVFRGKLVKVTKG